MKKTAILIALLIVTTLVTYSQSKWIGFKGFLQNTEPVNLERHMEQETGSKDLKSGVWQARFNTGLEAIAVYPKLDETGKMVGLDSRAFSAFIFGLFFTHAKPDGFQDWSAGPFVSLPNIAAGYDRYGIGIAGAYSIFKLGLKYDIGLPPNRGLCFMTGIKIDVFNNIQ